MSKAMKTYTLLKRPVTPNLKDPHSKDQEPDQPFRLASPIPPIATRSPDKGGGWVKGCNPKDTVHRCST